MRPVPHDVVVVNINQEDENRGAHTGPNIYELRAVGGLFSFTGFGVSLLYARDEATYDLEAGTGAFGFMGYPISIGGDNDFVALGGTFMFIGFGAAISRDVPFGEITGGAYTWTGYAVDVLASLGWTSQPAAMGLSGGPAEFEITRAARINITPGVFSGVDGMPGTIWSVSPGTWNGPGLDEFQFLLDGVAGPWVEASSITLTPDMVGHRITARQRRNGSAAVNATGFVDVTTTYATWRGFVATWRGVPATWRA